MYRFTYTKGNFFEDDDDDFDDDDFDDDDGDDDDGDDDDVLLREERRPSEGGAL